jgi:opacity protein-like surface antigen
MVAFKAVALTTVAVLALARAASAADLLPPPPAVEPPPPPIEVGGWYLRGDVGVGFNNSVSASTSPSALNYLPSGSTGTDNWYNASLSEAALFDVGVGYQVNNWFRADVTGELRGGSSFSGLEVVNVQNGNSSSPQYADFYRGSVSSEIALVNAYFDMGTWYGVTPYVGGGVGVAFNNFYGGTDNGIAGTGFSVSPAGGILGASTQTSLAWALMAGFDMKVTRHLKFEIGYRYLDYGNFKSGTSQCLTGNGSGGSFNSNFCTGGGYTIASSHTLSSNDVRVGLRYYFDNDVAEAPPEAPIVRRY